MLNESKFINSTSSGTSSSNTMNKAAAGNMSKAGGTAAGNMSKAGGTAAGNMSKAGGTAAGNMSKAGGATGNTSTKILTNASKVVSGGLKGLGNLTFGL
jgi:hypothetical protein